MRLKSLPLWKSPTRVSKAALIMRTLGMLVSLVLHQKEKENSLLMVMFHLYHWTNWPFILKKGLVCGSMW